MDANPILAKILLYPAKIVVFTGGEPFLQLDEKLVRLVKAHRRLVHVETNGTILPAFEVDWLTVSPKESWKLRHGDELKVVYTGQALWKYFVRCRFNHYFLQPCSMENTQEVIEICKKDPRWRLSLQTHKMLKIQ
jgi:7-carboxy-7-deazaguanine synthase